MVKKKKADNIDAERKTIRKDLNELIAVTKRVGLPGFTARQMADWLYKKEIQSIEEMTNLSKKARELLAADYEIWSLRTCQVSLKVQTAQKNTCIKY